ncbi:MAG: AbrB family transcriptional regulator, partial [Deltaproteobacteria bacterium]|nr:AbrB family transcriptional regulator [Deltaproteobacteria bacterium]
SKYQATVPEKVRDILGLKKGDLIEFNIGNKNQVILRKISPADLAFARSLEGTLTEWSSDNDEEAYRDL